MEFKEKKGKQKLPKPYCKRATQTVAREILYTAIENLEKTKGQYYSFIKKYIFEFENNDDMTNSKLKKIINCINKNLKEKDENIIIKNLWQGLNKLKPLSDSKFRGDDIYALLCLCLKEHPVSKIKKLIR